MQLTADLKNKLTDAKLCCETGDYEKAYKLYADVRDASASHAEADAGLEFVRLAIKEHISPGTLCQLVYRLMLHE